MYGKDEFFIKLHVKLKDMTRITVHTFPPRFAL